MATLRLFAGLADVAGTRSLAVDVATVGEAIAQASQQFGHDFAEQVQTCRVWLNGEPAEMSAEVRDGDEIALLPPVSGG